jgi:hypothetical protein
MAGNGAKQGPDRPTEREASGAAKQFSPDIHGGAP